MKIKDGIHINEAIKMLQNGETVKNPYCSEDKYHDFYLSDGAIKCEFCSKEYSSIEEWKKDMPELGWRVWATVPPKETPDEK